MTKHSGGEKPLENRDVSGPATATSRRGKRSEIRRRIRAGAFTIPAWPDFRSFRKRGSRRAHPKVMRPTFAGWVETETGALYIKRSYLRLKVASLKAKVKAIREKLRPEIITSEIEPKSMSGEQLIYDAELDRWFDNDKARIGYRTAEEVAQLVNTLPPEEPRLSIQAITFDSSDPLNEHRGLVAIYTAGTVIFTDREDVVLVPERSRNILDQLGISYHIASPVSSEESSKS